MCFLGRHISIKPHPRHFYIHLEGVFFSLQITCMHLFCCLQFLILLFPKQPLCWLPKPSSTVTEGEAVSLVLLFWAAQHSFSWHSLQRVVAEISAQTPLQVQSPCSAVMPSFLWSWIVLSLENGWTALLITLLLSFNLTVCWFLYYLHIFSVMNSDCC